MLYIAWLVVGEKGRKERNGRKMEGMLDVAGLWKERKEWEKDGKNAGRCSIVEGKKGMGVRWRECWTDCGRKERNGRKMEGMLDVVGLWKEEKERKED
jgi:hypothetical protein